jgi:hypothetical protein
MYTRDRSDIQSIQIKVEVDAQPPTGSDFETKLLGFPTPYSIATQSLPSLFAGKLHALLCREYIKGRDWFDFTWYVTRQVSINYVFLKHALLQQGPWANQLSLDIDRQWLTNELKKKVNSINWDQAKQDVESFLKPRDRESVKLWNFSFFEHFIEKIVN